MFFGICFDIKPSPLILRAKTPLHLEMKSLYAGDAPHADANAQTDNLN